MEIKELLLIGIFKVIIGSMLVLLHILESWQQVTPERFMST